MTTMTIEVAQAKLQELVYQKSDGAWRLRDHYGKSTNCGNTGQ